MLQAILKRFHQQDDAATSVEYAVMLMLIAAVCIAAIQLVGVNANAIWADNQNGVNSVLGNLN